MVGSIPYLSRRLEISGTVDAILDAGLFHQSFYERQRSERFGTAAEAAEDFFDEGVSRGLSPHPLFDTRFYLRTAPDLVAAGINPLTHYLSEGWRQGRDPHPLFDNDWYLTQLGAHRRENPLVHYLAHHAAAEASPNPLFDGAFYLRQHADLAGTGIVPLEHYVLYGRNEHRPPSAAFSRLLPDWYRPATSLKRGAFQRQHVVWIAWLDGFTEEAAARVAATVEALSRDRRADIRLVTRSRELLDQFTDDVTGVSLDDVGVPMPGDAAFQASLRLLLFALSAGLPRLELWEVAVAGPVAPAFTELGLPVTVAATPPEPRSLSHEKISKRVYLPCLDWSLSGVHTVAEALGEELIARGWDVRLLFTRGTIGVLDRTTEDRGLPRIPYEFLDVSACHSMRDRWAAIIRHFEWRAPCVVLATFDDFANAVAPALSDEIGVVGWLQSDENHYYESVNRLGRYWNAVVCVSEHIRERAAAVQPAVAARAHVIHNTTMRRDDVVERSRRADDAELRLVYVGRLVQHQKRVLDVVALVRELNERRLNYRVTLIGGSPDDAVESQLRRQLVTEMATGRVRLTGPLSRPAVLDELHRHDVVVLFSEFEGLPVALVEAMACGCVPAVLRTDSGVPELVGHGRNGLLFESREYGAWADVLGELSRDPQRLAALASRAQQTIRDHFTVERMADQFEQVLTTVQEQVRSRAWTRPPVLTSQRHSDDVLVPPSLQQDALG